MKELLEFTYSIPPKQMSFSVLMETVTSSSDQSFVTTASLPKGKIGGYKFASITQPGGVARSDVLRLIYGKSRFRSIILTSGNILSWRLVMK